MCCEDKTVPLESLIELYDFMAHVIFKKKSASAIQDLLYAKSLDCRARQESFALCW